MAPSVGYSGTPLVKKLGLKNGYRALALGAPEGYRAMLSPEPERVEWVDELSGHFDFIHFFTRSKNELESWLPRLDAALLADGMIWISWPKKASKVSTDVDDRLVRETALAQGLVDVKVCAVDATWSGLKLMVRRADRAGRRQKS